MKLNKAPSFKVMDTITEEAKEDEPKLTSANLNNLEKVGINNPIPKPKT